MKPTTLANRTLFVISVIATGAIAGAFVWLLLFVMNLGITFLWEKLPAYFGPYFPLAACVVGGLIIGLFAKRFGPYPEDLNTVMSKVKKEGRYDYHDLGPMSIAALLPLFFGGSIGPEAGLTGAIAGICTWVGDRMKRFGADFQQLTSVGTMAALSAIFTAPLFGFAAPLTGDSPQGEGAQTIELPKTSKVVVYFCAIAGALGAFMGLGALTGGGGLSLPRFTDLHLGTHELAWALPIAAVGAAGGWLYCVFDSVLAQASTKMGDKPVLKAVIAGIVLAVAGIALPFTMFAGETQAEQLGEMWTSLSALTLIATGLVKVFVTPLCIRFGWRGGHFFPVIFAGISLGYGMATLTGVDPVFALCASTAALMGAVMRKPLMTVLLLFMCFPVKALVILLPAAALGAIIPLPKFAQANEKSQQPQQARP
ncbi:MULTISPECIES: chloride channel protein [Gordonibacter]|uniref:Chloride channel protein n=1 Tax=Gordonibacter faecis TaxID=3047475 RepID=A0ABT7DI34_9ACTN|nr:MULTISPECIES: chloride channel protein [unclassified Gordonibacter]MDJ1649181.1 chloride channel protein [Gordonibacter sp. KGMB12511]HIW76183.1 chloride channel protein [Candidatus Gordonibacter avicola]